MTEPIHIISLGAGVQSSTMALMAACGEITPMPTAAIFADTQAEPNGVYEWLNWLERQLPFPVHRVTKGSLAEAALRVRTSKAGNRYSQHAIPAFMLDPDGKTGILMRQCTRDFKIDTIQREIRRIRKELDQGPIVQWIGISVDEAHRMKPSRLSYIEHRWPLVDKRISRKDCLQWMSDKGYPKPPRSSCVFCPYHNDAEWLRLKTDEPEGFQVAVEWEKQFQATCQITRYKGTPFLHKSCVPLSEVDFTKPSAQISLFGNECEGVCGV